MLVGSVNTGTDESQQVATLSLHSHTQYLSVSSSSHPSLFSLSPPRLTSLVLSGVCLVDLIVEPHVSHGHAVLGQCARLVRADGGGGAKSFYGLQVLYQTVLLGHSLGSESQAHLGGQWEVRGCRNNGRGGEVEVNEGGRRRGKDA